MSQASPKTAPRSSARQPADSRIADNKKAIYNYHIEERFEAGMVLQGWEVKALREGKVQLTDGYVVIRSGELFLIGLRINALRSASTPISRSSAGEEFWLIRVYGLTWALGAKIKYLMIR